jgi:hypothetical protein
VKGKTWSTWNLRGDMEMWHNAECRWTGRNEDAKVMATPQR